MSQSEPYMENRCGLTLSCPFSSEFPIDVSNVADATERYLMGYATSLAANQPAHPRSRIRTDTVRNFVTESPLAVIEDIVDQYQTIGDW